MSLRKQIVFHKRFTVDMSILPDRQLQSAVELWMSRNGRYINFPTSFSWEWERQHSEDGFDGTLPKRIAKLYFLQSGLKLDSANQGSLGEMVRRFVPQQTLVEFDFDDEIGWPAGQFADSGSCFLSDLRRPAVQAIRKWKGFAMRRWNGEEGAGRCWVLPSADDLIVFNCYDRQKFQFSLASYAQALALHLNTDWLEINPIGEYDGDAHTFGGTLYANGRRGVLVGPSESIKAQWSGSGGRYQFEMNR